MKSTRRYEWALTDLVDALTISQIRQSLVPEHSITAKRDLADLTRDIDATLAENKAVMTSEAVKLVLFISQANLRVWLNKERMLTDESKYFELLEFAQELNGLRNHARNRLMSEWNEMRPARKRATFLKQNSKQWYRSILNDLGN